MHPRVVRTEACFLAMAAPSLDDALSRAAQLPYRRVVVQPHLLFEGELSERVRKATQSAAHRSADQEWIVAECLGPHHLLAAAIREAAPGQLMESRL
jgi:sirohydrochlorin ferrochelatase